jgi:hypothetical protein
LFASDANGISGRWPEKNDSSNLEVILSLFLNVFAICLFSPGLIKDLERALEIAKTNTARPTSRAISNQMTHCHE